MWVSEANLETIGKGVTEEAMPDFLSAWKEDLKGIKGYTYKEDAVEVANAYLKYFGSSNRVVDVRRDVINSCLSWDVREQKVKAN